MYFVDFSTTTQFERRDGQKETDSENGDGKVGEGGVSGQDDRLHLRNASYDNDSQTIAGTRMID